MNRTRWTVLPVAAAICLGPAVPAGAASDVSEPIPTPAPSQVPPPGASEAQAVKRPARVPVSVSVSPEGAGRVGVGQLVTMTFSQPVMRRKKVEQAIDVRSRRAIPAGSWGWLDRQTAVYRPKTFWPGHAKIKFVLDLRGQVFAKQGRTKYVGNRFADRTFVLKTGRSFILKIRDSRHRMYVVRDGRIVRNFPVSLGKAGYRTRSGIKIITGEKYTRLRMTGTDRFSGERWDVISPFSIMLTPSGEYIHGAPWAYYRLGQYNGSHGCTNMYVSDARWLFHRVRSGDPVVTKGTGRPMEVTNGTPGSYWNYSWSAWKAKSALH